MLCVADCRCFQSSSYCRHGKNYESLEASIAAEKAVAHLKKIMGNHFFRVEPIDGALI